MQCNLCDTITDVPKYYKPKISPNNYILNRTDHPELNYTSYEFLVNDTYRTKIL